MVAIYGFTRERVIAAVREMYTAVATAPERPYHFPVGRGACLAVGYAPGDLEGVPDEALASFAGVGCPFRAGSIHAGDTVLDLGAGAGTDSCIAARLAGSQGTVYAVDMTPAMLEKLRALKARHRITQLQVLEGSAEAIPLPDACVDVVTSNGVLNLVPDKRKAVAEIFRVLKPGGRAQVADIVIARPIDADCGSDPTMWAECVVGATVDEEYLHLFRDAGFEEVTVARTHDYFALSGSADTRDIARRFGAHAVEIGMRRADPRRALAALRRRGLAGTAALLLSMATCYGSLAAAALLSAAGGGVAINSGAVAGIVVVLAGLAALAVASGARRHGAWLPFGLAVAGAAVLAWVLLARYDPVVELLGFALLAIAVAWDFRLRREPMAP